MELEVSLQTEQMTKPQVISRTNFRNMYWNMAQQLAHQTVNGTNVQVGDLYASGTVSGDEPDTYGSMLELAWRGERPTTMEETGEERKFLQDGDRVTMSGYCHGDGYRVGFGEVEGKVVPA
jgi:fumarylacetoacetase